MLPVVSLLVILLVALVVAVGAVVVGLARMLLRPPRMTDGKAMYVLRRMSPGDVGLASEPVRFDVRSGDQRLAIAGWWIEAAAPSERTCVIIHGYADAKVGALAWAPMWRDLGFNLLLIDLRAHGESGGTDTTGGFRERDDVDAVLDQLRARWPAQTGQLVLFGVSLGGAVALAVAARRDDLAAVVADSVFADYRSAALVHGEQIKAPSRWLQRLAISLAERMSGADFGSVAPVRTLPACRCPVMLIHGEVDDFVPEPQRLALAEAMRSRNEPRDANWLVPEAGHVLGIVADQEGYAERVRAFVEDAMTAARERHPTSS